MSGRELRGVRVGARDSVFAPVARPRFGRRHALPRFSTVGARWRDPQVVAPKRAREGRSRAPRGWGGVRPAVAVRLRCGCGAVRGSCGAVRGSCGRCAAQLRSLCGAVAVAVRGSCGRCAAQLRYSLAQATVAVAVAVQLRWRAVTVVVAMQLRWRAVAVRSGSSNSRGTKVAQATVAVRK